MLLQTTAEQIPLDGHGRQPQFAQGLDVIQIDSIKGSLHGEQTDVIGLALAIGLGGQFQCFLGVGEHFPAVFFDSAEGVFVPLEFGGELLLQFQGRAAHFAAGRGQLGLGLADVPLISIEKRQRDAHARLGDRVSRGVVVKYARLQIEVRNPLDEFASESGLGPIDALPGFGLSQRGVASPSKLLEIAQLHRTKLVDRQWSGVLARQANDARRGRIPAAFPAKSDDRNAYRENRRWKLSRHRQKGGGG